MNKSTAHLAALLKAHADGRHKLSFAKHLVYREALRERGVFDSILIVYKEIGYVSHRACSL